MSSSIMILFGNTLFSSDFTAGIGTGSAEILLAIILMSIFSMTELIISLPIPPVLLPSSMVYNFPVFSTELMICA